VKTKPLDVKYTIASQISALFIAAGTAQGTTTANLLVDPGYENNALVAYSAVWTSNFATQQGDWGTEAGSILSTTTDGVTPINSKMLGITNFGGGTASQTIQATNISLTPNSGDGTATFNMSARFTLGGGVLGGFAGGNAAIVARFFTGSSNALPNTTSIMSSSLVLDSDSKSWEPLTLTGTIPTGTTWMVMEVLYNNESIGSNTGYVDDASFTITTIPEPSGYALLGLGACVLISRRRRGQACLER
jgi:hypothetical protein